MIPVRMSRCLCPPTPDPGPHMCISGGGPWVEGPGGWWRIDYPRSQYRASQALSVCDAWDDVLLLVDSGLLSLTPPKERS